MKQYERVMERFMPTEKEEIREITTRWEQRGIAQGIAQGMTQDTALKRMTNMTCEAWSRRCSATSNPKTRFFRTILHSGGPDAMSC